MRPYMHSLIERMTTKEPSAKNSEDSVSWKAYREAERIKDASIVSELDSWLLEGQAKDERSAAYFIIGKIGKNLQSEQVARLLISYIDEEKDKYSLASLLDQLGDIPKNINENLAPIYLLLIDKRWLVRHSAIRALKNTSCPEAEEQVLEILRQTNDMDDMVYCHATLNKIGTEKSLPQLEAALKSRKRDVKISAKMAIEAIRARGVV